MTSLWPAFGPVLLARLRPLSSSKIWWCQHLISIVTEAPPQAHQHVQWVTVQWVVPTSSVLAACHKSRCGASPWEWGTIAETPWSRNLPREWMRGDLEVSENGCDSTSAGTKLGLLPPAPKPQPVLPSRQPEPCSPPPWTFSRLICAVWFHLVPRGGPRCSTRFSTASPPAMPRPSGQSLVALS